MDPNSSTAPPGEAGDPGGHHSISSSSSSSCSSSSVMDLAPQMQQQFVQLSRVLMETNENLHTFEFMLNQYRQLAKIPPTPGAIQEVTENHEKQSDKFQQLLEGLTQAVDRMHIKSSHHHHAAFQEDSLRLQEKYDDLFQRSQELRLDMAREKGLREQFEAKNQLLEREMASKISLNEQLTESVHRARAALAEERAKSETLDRKLEVEQRAAKRVGQDITKYVESMKALEEEVVLLRKEKKQRHHGGTKARGKNVDMAGDDATETESASPDPILAETQSELLRVRRDLARETDMRHCLEEEVVHLRQREKKNANATKPKIEMSGDLMVVEIEPTPDPILAEAQSELSRIRAELAKEKDTRNCLEMKVVNYEDQVLDYEAQLTDLKSGLETLHLELEKCHNVSKSAAATAVVSSKVQSHPSAAGRGAETPESPETGKEKEVGEKKESQKTLPLEADLRKQREKYRVLVKKYRVTKENLGKQTRKIDKVKSTLSDIRTVCSRTEENYREIINHLGSEIEIGARLMAAYLNLSLSFHPIVLYGRVLSDWFADISALSSWLRGQIVAFGKRYWTDQEPRDIRKRVLPFPQIPAVATAAATTDNTLSELSQSLNNPQDEEALSLFVQQQQRQQGGGLGEDKNRSIRELVVIQDKIIKSRDSALEELLALK